jgi:hypothetical protein
MLCINRWPRTAGGALDAVGLGDSVQRIIFVSVAQRNGVAADGVVRRNVVFLHGDVAVIIAGIEEGVTGAARLIAEVGDQRAAIPCEFFRTLLKF